MLEKLLFVVLNVTKMTLSYSWIDVSYLSLVTWNSHILLGNTRHHSRTQKLLLRCSTLHLMKVHLVRLVNQILLIYHIDWLNSLRLAIIESHLRLLRQVIRLNSLVLRIWVVAYSWEILMIIHILLKLPLISISSSIIIPVSRIVVMKCSHCMQVLHRDKIS